MARNTRTGVQLTDTLIGNQKGPRAGGCRKEKDQTLDHNWDLQPEFLTQCIRKQAHS